MKDSAEWFVGGVSFGLFVFMVQTPLLTQLYQTNYPNRTRGLLFSIVAIARGLSPASGPKRVGAARKAGLLPETESGKPSAGLSTFQSAASKKRR